MVEMAVSFPNRCRNFLFILSFFVNMMVASSNAMDTFIVSFQSQGTKSINHWMKYNKMINGFEKEFSACHWQKIRFFSLGMNAVWSYCFILQESDNDLKCIQLVQKTSSDAGRNVDLWAFISRVGREIRVDSIPFKHREWNHICFIYSSIEKMAKFYYNGKLLGSEISENFTDPINSNSIYKSSFTVAQEPDTINGGYSSNQLFNGDISELNIWSRLVSDAEIRSMAECTVLIRGDIVAWEQNNFQINEAKVIGSQNKNIFCKAERKLAIFPQRRSFQGAKSLCKIHGGKLVVPLSSSDNKKILDILSKHRRTCLEGGNVLDKGHATWLGMERYHREWYDKDSTGQLQLINYTHWNMERCTNTDCGDGNFGCPYIE